MTTDTPGAPFNGAEGFMPAPIRLIGEVETRKANAARALGYHVGALDDYIRAILPHDLVLIGAGTGIGKTELAMLIATSNAERGKSVGFFALEAEPNEIESRAKYAVILREMWRMQPDVARTMTYVGWLLGEHEERTSYLNRWADLQVAQRFEGLQTLYRGSVAFGHEQLRKRVEETAKYCDLFVVDHIHYLDAEEDETETMKKIRDICLGVGRPGIVVAHLRKKMREDKRITTTLDEFHGSSNLTKIATQIIALDRAPRFRFTPYYHHPTFVSILKDRRQGPPLGGLGVMRCTYDSRKRGYDDAYTLGRLAKGGTAWEPLGRDDVPPWSKRHIPLDAQETLPLDDGGGL